MIKKTIVLGIILSTSIVLAQARRPLVSIPVVHLISDNHNIKACKEKRKDILLHANQGQYFAGFEGLYDKQYIQYYVEAIEDFEFDLQQDNKIYALENEAVYKSGLLLSLLQVLDQTIRTRMDEQEKKSQGQAYDPEKINFLGDRLSLSFADLQNKYTGDTRLRKKFEEYLGISLKTFYASKQNIINTIQSKYPNILSFINAFNKGFLWDEIRPMSNDNLFASYLKEVFDSLPGDLKNESVILDPKMIQKAKEKALELEDFKQSRDLYSRSQPEYWLYSIYWRNQMFIKAFDQMYMTWKSSEDNINKEIYIVAGVDHIQDLHDRIKRAYAIDAQIDRSCHD